MATSSTTDPLCGLQMLHPAEIGNSGNSLTMSTSRFQYESSIYYLTLHNQSLWALVFSNVSILTLACIMSTTASGLWGPAPAGVDLSQNHNAQIIASVSGVTVIVLFAVLLRLWARVSRLGPGLGTDDYVI